MSNSEILNYQLDKFREVMEQYKKKREQRIVFIHGKGDGVLRKALLDELKRKYRLPPSGCFVPGVWIWGDDGDD